VAVFAAAAATLACVGLFAVMATVVRQRTHEFGVRMALGATARGVGLMVLRRGMTLALIGTAAGLAGAVVTNRLLAAMLFEVEPADVTTLALVAGGVVVVAVVACAIPARAGTHIDPAVALRSE
jgi:ABC-type antimicrobial peptide transport system permease subunit